MSEMTIFDEWMDDVLGGWEASLLGEKISSSTPLLLSKAGTVSGADG